MCRAVVLLINPIIVCWLCCCHRCCGFYNGNYTLHQRYLRNYHTCNTTFKYVGFALKLITSFQQLFTRLCKMSVQSVETCCCDLSWKFHILQKVLKGRPGRIKFQCCLKIDKKLKCKKMSDSERSGELTDEISKASMWQKALCWN